METKKLKSDYQAPDTGVLKFVGRNVLCESPFSIPSTESITEETFEW